MKVNISKLICACSSFVGWLIFRAGTQRVFSLVPADILSHWGCFIQKVENTIIFSHECGRQCRTFLYQWILNTTINIIPSQLIFPSFTAFLPLFSDHLPAHFQGQDRNITLNKAQNSTSFFSFLLLSLYNWAPPEAETLKANSVRKRVSSCGWTMGSSFVQHFDLG